MATITTAEGIRLAYELTGEGPPLVLVHGITENRRSWDPLLPALAASHTVVAVDLRGHGESGPAPVYDLVSMAADVHEVATRLELTEPLLVGHSLGGTVVTAYANAYPCSGVLNVDQPLALSAFQEGLRQLEPMLRGDEASFRGAITMVFDAMAGPLSGDQRDRIAALRRPDQQVVLAIWAPVLERPVAELDELVRSLTASIDVPYLSLHGIDPGADYEIWLGNLIPGALVERWPDHGHYPHLVDPERFLARLAEFESEVGDG